MLEGTFCRPLEFQKWASISCTPDLNSNEKKIKAHGEPQARQFERRSSFAKLYLKGLSPLKSMERVAQISLAKILLSHQLVPNGTLFLFRVIEVSEDLGRAFE